MTCPIWSYEAGEGVLTSQSRGFWVIGIVRLSVTVGAWVEVTVTVLASWPLPGVGEPFALSWVCVNAWVAVQVIDAPGARVVPGQVIPVALLSLSRIPVTVTLPVFVTR